MIKRFGLFLVMVTFAVIVTLITLYYQRPSGEIVQFGNLCDIDSWMQCYRPRLSAGFPFAFVFDTPGVSVVNNVHLAEDESRLLPFVVNVWFYTVLIIFTLKSIKK